VNGEPKLSQPRFKLGKVLATPGALKALCTANKQLFAYLSRHVSGDWGCVCPEDARENELSLQNGSRLLSAYMLDNKVKLWIITEADRSATTLLLPDGAP
jgi:hypothetical protein